MLKKFISILFLALAFFGSNTVSGQEIRHKYLGVEGGMDFQGVNVPDYDFIRGEISYYPEYYGSSSQLQGSYQKWYLGAKTEIRSKSNRFGLFAGLRFSRVNSSLGKNQYWSDNSEFFYLLYKQEGTTTEYLRIREINRASNYIGIPLEVRFFPYRPRLFRLYFKAATELSYRISTSTEVVFDDSAMDQFQKDVLNKFDGPGNFYSSFSIAAGIKIGRDDKPNINLEAVLPSFVLTNKSSGLVNTISGGGLQLNVQFPF